MVDRLNNFIQILNELIVVQCTVWLFLFTRYVTDPVVQYQFGEIYIYIIAGNIAVNFIFLVLSLLLIIYRGIRRTYIRSKNKRAYLRAM